MRIAGNLLVYFYYESSLASFLSRKEVGCRGEALA